MKKAISFCFVYLYLFAYCGAARFVFSQDAPPSDEPGDARTEETAPESALPSSYRNIELGMDAQTVKDILKKDALFGYRGERDVSFLANPERTLIETAGSSFISRAWFQFYDDSLYIMTFALNRDEIDYFSMYTALTQKYGEPAALNPSQAFWDDGRVRLSLERPLTIKYIDAEVFAALIDSSRQARSYGEILRRDFINEF